MNTPPKSPPKLTLVAHNDETALRARGALADLRWNTSQMLPNLLAVMRGSGQAKDLIHQLIDVASAIEESARLSSDDLVQAELRQLLEAGMPPWSESIAAEPLRSSPTAG